MHWIPGKTGLVVDVPTPQFVEELPTPLNASRVKKLHITALSSRSMKPISRTIGAHWHVIRPDLPPLPSPIFEPTLYCATRPPHPSKDPANHRIDRQTHFLVVENQAEFHAWLNAIVEVFSQACQRNGTQEFGHPEPNRFFHLSVFNNRGGDPRQSIGDISQSDLFSL